MRVRRVLGRNEVTMSKTKSTKTPTLTKAQRRFICEPHEIDLSFDEKGACRHLTCGAHYKMVRLLREKSLCSEILRYQKRPDIFLGLSEPERSRIEKQLGNNQNWRRLYTWGSGMIVTLTDSGYALYQEHKDSSCGN